MIEPTEADIEAIRAAAESADAQGWADCVTNEEWRAAIAEWERLRTQPKEPKA